MSEPPPQYGYQVPPLGPVPPALPFADPSDPLISPDYSGWVRRNVALIKAYWRPLAVLETIGAVATLVVWLPTQIVAALGSRDLQSTTPADNTQVLRALGTALPSVGAGVAGSILAALITVLVTLAGMRLIVVGLTSGRLSVGDALQGALRRLLPLVGWGVLAGLIVLVGLCACFLPGLYFVAVFGVLQAVVLFERGEVIGRCFKLFHADLGAAVARVATIMALTIATAVVSAALGAIVNAVVQSAVAGTAGLVGATVVSTVFDTLIGAVSGLLIIPLVLTTYADERARLEPLHTGVLAHELTTA